jgi:hypothetical protein
MARIVEAIETDYAAQLRCRQPLLGCGTVSGQTAAARKRHCAGPLHDRRGPAHAAGRKPKAHGALAAFLRA